MCGSVNCQASPWIVRVPVHWPHNSQSLITQTLNVIHVLWIKTGPTYESASNGHRWSVSHCPQFHLLGTKSLRFQRGGVALWAEQRLVDEAQRRSFLFFFSLSRTELCSHVVHFYEVVLDRKKGKRNSHSVLRLTSWPAAGVRYLLIKDSRHNKWMLITASLLGGQVLENEGTRSVLFSERKANHFSLFSVAFLWIRK